jgi:hypothetical protein
MRFQECLQQNRGMSPVIGVIHMFFDKKKDDPKKKKPQSSPFRIAWMLSIKNRKYQLERHSNSSVVVF